MGVRVLIVEDEANIVESLSFVLQRAGHDVTVAADGEAALVQLRRIHRPKVMILDVMLPLRNGFEVLKAVRSDARLKDMAVIMLTAKAQAHDRQLAEDIGVDAYVSKPFSNRDIVEQVERLAALQSR